MNAVRFHRQIQMFAMASLVLIAQALADDDAGGKVDGSFLDATKCVEPQKHVHEANGSTETFLVNNCGRKIALLACRCYVKGDKQYICDDTVNSNGWYCQKSNDFFGNPINANTGPSSYYKQDLDSPPYGGDWAYRYAACTIHNEPNWSALKKSPPQKTDRAYWVPVQFEDACLQWVQDVSVIVVRTGQSPRYLATAGKLPKFKKAASPKPN